MKTKPRVIKAENYSVYIGDGSIKRLNNYLNLSKYNNSRFFILVDENSLQHCLPTLVIEVDKLKEAEIIEIESGEENKNIEICLQLWKTLSELEADRKSVFVNLGGGVISDIGGFVASTFKRGIDFINIPTTLLAQVDASLGGKTGIDLDHLKNEIGLFSNPKAVFIFPDFIHTLDKRQVLSGFAEIIKHALIADHSFWTLLKSYNLEKEKQWMEIIHHSIEIKNEIVLKDPNEKDTRKALNFGHTIGHAVESFFLESEISILHGEAIIIGMICEAFLSVKKSKLKTQELEEITLHLISIYGIKKIAPSADKRILELMRHDKKNEKGNINFTLLSRIGQAEINKSCDDKLIKEALNYYRNQRN